MSWQQYRDILQRDAEVRREERDARPVDCPNDGTPLEERDGILHCPFDGWTWEGA